MSLRKITDERCETSPPTWLAGCYREPDNITLDEKINANRKTAMDR